MEKIILSFIAAKVNDKSDKMRFKREKFHSMRVGREKSAVLARFLLVGLWNKEEAKRK